MSLPAVSLEQFLGLLNSVTKVGANWQAKCPGHEDGRASLSVALGRHNDIILKCFAGCSFEQILAPLNLSPQQLFAPAPSRDPFKKILTAIYDYRDAAGALVFQVCRFEPKDFRQRRPDPALIGQWIWDMKGVARVPYRLNELQGQQTVYVAEGEKDVDALWALGLPATTNAGGASKWRDADSAALKAAGVTRVVLLPDNDNPGRKHVEAVATSVKAVGIAVMLVPLPTAAIKGDVSDWLASGGTRDELQAIVAKALWIVPKGTTLDEPPLVDPALDPSRWPLSDLGAAEAFVDRFGDHVRYDHRQGRWLVWDAHRWLPDATKAIRRLAHQHARAWQHEALEMPMRTDPERQKRDAVLSFARKLERRGGLDNMLHEAHAMLPIADDGTTWDSDPMLLGCPNGVVELTSGCLRPGSPSDRITMQVTAAFVPDAPCPRWEQFLGELFDTDPELIGFIQRALGYCLTGDMREQCFFLCVGSGSNGKSTFLGTLNAVWADYGYQTDTRTFAPNAGSVDTTPFDLAELAGRRLILASETKANSRMNEQALKNFTGGEKINAQRKYGHPFEFQPVGKLWMGLNHQPKVGDDSFGFWRRVRLIPFTRIFAGSGDDRSLSTSLRREAPGILAWVVRGTVAWLRDGLLPPPSVIAATDAYQEAEDPLADFIEQCCTPDPAASILSARAYKQYRDWADTQSLTDRERLTHQMFGRRMSRRFDSKRTTDGVRYLSVSIHVRDNSLF